LRKLYESNTAQTLHSLKYLKRNFFLLPVLMLISIPIAYYFKGYSWETSLKVGPLFNLGAFLILGCLPTLIVHFSHYWNSKDLKLFIDFELGKIVIDQQGQYQYDLESLQFTEHLALAKKRHEDGRFRIITPWSNFSYIKIRAQDDREFNISSTIINSKDFPVDISHKEYTLWPVIQ